MQEAGKKQKTENALAETLERERLTLEKAERAKVAMLEAERQRALEVSV